MPILDPAYSSALFKEIELPDSKFSKHFFLRYLRIASRFLYRNSQTIEASIQFKKDLKSSIKELNEIFGCKFNHESQFDDPTVKDYYKFLYDNIDPKYKENLLKNQKGRFKVIYDNFEIFFFQPFIDIPQSRSWFFTNSSYVILVFCYLNDQSLKLTNLEIDLMHAVGFQIVLCVEDISTEIFEQIVTTHKFAEIHFFIDDKDDEDDEDDKFFTSLSNIIEKIDCYFYLYTQFVLEKKSKAYGAIKKLKLQPRFRCILTSKKISFAIKKLKSEKARPFVYCKTGFEDDNLRIFLCNVPLYKTADYRHDFCPIKISGNSIGYISKMDFMDYSKTRVKIFYEDFINNGRYIESYIDSNYINYIKSDMYVCDTINLTKTNETINKTIDRIFYNIYTIKTGYKKEKIISFFKKKKMIEGLSYICCIYGKLQKKKKDFHIHKNQIFAVFEALQKCLYEKKRTNKGILFQVETGEGKSCIIQIVAAVLALMNKTVHIASSNITLSNRDYYESLNFFNQFGLESAVLLHYNELPYVNIDNTINKNSIYSRSKFPKKYFSKKLFQNSSNMNFSVCGINADNEITKDKANIIFSTFVNFESLYLKIMEMCPSFIPKCFGSCSLVIDEADSILIDEITNGTILSRPIKSNANEILEYVYDCHMNNINAQFVYSNIHKKWPECKDLKLDDVEFMFDDIDTIRNPEFENGKKYIIDEFELKDEKSLLNSLKKSWEDVKQKKEKCKKQMTSFFKNKFIKKKGKDKDKVKTENEHNHKHKDSEEKKIDKAYNVNNKSNEKNKHKKVKAIIPFDYDHKGISEPNKEFSGFVQQFIAIKEKREKKEENSNLVMKEVSLNYLFVSHPIFVQIYDVVIGLTGTIGNKYDKKILKDQYDLITMKIPRNKPNFRVELPIFLCNDINERNRKIVTDVIHFHENNNPVLVIFQDLNEIISVLYMLINKGITNVNIFDGKDERIKPDMIAGLKGAVSLGTNVCGRGTDIKKPYKPLHVIVTYFTSNSRVMQQAFGRTARQGEEGTVRIICLKEQYFSPIEILNQMAMDTVLDDFKFKNKLQVDYLDKFKKKREWIFYGKMKTEELSNDVIEKLRETRINANRIKVCEFSFPICMKIKTFLNIQAQKIFSLYNCPNCKYTWMLFQKYIREMILESWSLLIDNSERKYNKKKRSITYQQYLLKKVEKLYFLIEEYLPDSEYEKSYSILDTFMYIHTRVLVNYESKIMRIFPEELARLYKQNFTKRFCSFYIGFKPYSLVDESGAKINTIDGEDQDQHYISDPELKYMKKEPKGKFSILSITEKIDGVFNKICQKINEVIGSYIGLRFFLRRTLGGCEFGVCLDYDIEIPASMKEYDCLIDQDPLLMFTISVRSMAPILAGILIIGLVYLVSMSGSITEWIMTFPQKITRSLIKKALVEVCTLILSSQIELVCNGICGFLMKILSKQVDKIDNQDKKISAIFKILMKLISAKDFSISGDQIQKLFEKKVKLNVKTNFGKRFLKENLPWQHFVKIGFLLMLCFASFMMNFHLHRQSLKYNESKVAEDFDKKQDVDLSLNQNINAVKKDDFDPIKKDMKDLKLQNESNNS